MSDPGSGGKPKPPSGGGDAPDDEPLKKLEAEKQIEKIKADNEKLLKPDKEKLEHKEYKNEFKEYKNEHKELKPDKEKLEKEHKLEKFEHKHEIKEIKNEKLEHKDLIKIEIGETKDFEIDPGGPVSFDKSALAAQADALEEAARQLRHFIETGERPDLRGGALRNEPDEGDE
jgi:hypothetical protein